MGIGGFEDSFGEARGLSEPAPQLWAARNALGPAPRQQVQRPGRIPRWRSFKVGRQQFELAPGGARPLQGRKQRGEGVHPSSVSP